MSEESDKENSPREKAELSYKTALELETKQAYSKAIYHFENALKGFETNPDVQKKILLRLSYCFEYLSDFQNAIEYQKKLLASLNEGDESIYYQEQRLLSLFIKTNSVQNAIELSKKLSKEAALRSDFAQMVRLYNNIAYLFKIKGNKESSDEYFKKSLETLNSHKKQIKYEDQIAILLNLTFVHFENGDLATSKNLIKEAKNIALSNNDSLEYYKADVYDATLQLLSGNNNKAIEQLEAIVRNAEKSHHKEKNRLVILDASKVLCDFFYKKEDIYKYKFYSDKYKAIKESLYNEETEANRQLMLLQIEIEKNEYVLRKKLEEQEKKETLLRQTELENDNHRKSIKLQQVELDILQQTQKVQEEKLRREALEKQSISQTLNLTIEKAEKEKLVKEVAISSKENKIKQLELSKTIKENRILELESKARENSLKESKKLISWMVACVIIFFLAFIIILFFFKKHLETNKKLKQNEQLLKEQSEEIMVQNEELSEKNEELSTLSRELIVLNTTLEKRVDERTAELKQSNQELIQQANKAEQFSFIVSHNLRGPLARIKGLLELFKFIEMPNKDSKDFLARMEESVHSLDEVILDLNMILNVKRGINANITCFNVGELVDRVLTSLESHTKDANAKISIEIDKNLTINSVKPFLESIVYNLFSNAIKYKSEEREPKISLSILPKEGEKIEIIFTDNGIGLDLEKHEDKVFGLYNRFHTHVEGKGMGLFLTKTQVETMGGKITVESVVDQGTTFRIEIPNAENGIPILS